MLFQCICSIAEEKDRHDRQSICYLERDPHGRVRLFDHHRDQKEDS